MTYEFNQSSPEFEANLDAFVDQPRPFDGFLQPDDHQQALDQAAVRTAVRLAAFRAHVELDLADRAPISKDIPWLFFDETGQYVGFIEAPNTFDAIKKAKEKFSGVAPYVYVGGPSRDDPDRPYWALALRAGEVPEIPFRLNLEQPNSQY